MKDQFKRQIDAILFQIVFDSMGTRNTLEKKDITRALDDSRREFFKHRKSKSSEEADAQILEILKRSLEKETPGLGDIAKLFDNLGTMYEVLMEELAAGPVRVESRD